MIWFALTGVRAYVTLGDAKGANRWLALLRAGASLRPETALALKRIRPLVRMIGGGDNSTPIDTMISDWSESVAATPDLDAVRPLINGFFIALGEEVPAAAWQGLPADGLQNTQMPAPSIWFPYREASANLAASTAGVIPVTPTGGNAKGGCCSAWARPAV